MKKILIIEDDPFLSEMYCKKLKRLGFESRVAVNGKEGLEIVRQDRPDLILLDIVLPQVDGYEVLKRLKEDKELRKIPVIFLTNLGQKDEVEKGVSLGADAYIIKAHFTPTAVVNKIKEVLEKNK